MAIDINIPSQVKNYANLAGFPVTGTLKTIYIAEDTNKTYRWTGSAYVEISASQAAAWGTITGTLSSQTDLNTALSGKQPTVTLTTTGTSGASTFVANTLNVPTYSLSGLGGVPTSRTLTINGTTQDLSADRTFTISTGITIGTTAITSGTVGRVLFEGTGNVVSESANLFWDNTNGRLGIGTSSPLYKLDILGDALISTSFIQGTASAGGSSTFGMQNITPTSAFSGTLIHSQSQYLLLYSNASASTQYSGWAPATSSGIISLGNLVLGSGATQRMRVFSGTGNIGINTTTDAGFKLDVNGTARVSGNFTQSGVNTATLGYIINTGTVGTASNLPSAGSWAMVIGTVSNSGHTAIFTKGNNPNSTAIRITDQNVGASVNHFLVDYVGASGFGIANGTLQVNASAQVEIQSTTKGFLPPRMTTTQKNAIASPATGLMVYDTTLNLMALYNGTTWTTL